jgi:hypothetical protein
MVVVAAVGGVPWPSAGAPRARPPAVHRAGCGATAMVWFVCVLQACPRYSQHGRQPHALGDCRSRSSRQQEALGRQDMTALPRPTYVLTPPTGQATQCAPC